MAGERGGTDTRLPRFLIRLLDQILWCICSIKRNDRHTNSTQESSRFKATTDQESADMQSVRRYDGKHASLPTATKG